MGLELSTSKFLASIAYPIRWWIVWIALIGCQSQNSDHAGRLAHTISPHWPSSLADAHSKLQERLAILENSSDDRNAARELEEIISWLPEVAADSEITESQWQPIYDMSEWIRKRLSGGSPLDMVKGEVQQLLHLIHVMEEPVSLN